MSATRRDELVGAALRELRVPEHGAGFWEELEATLGAPPARRRRVRLRLGPPRLRLALAGLVALVAALALGLPRTETPPPALAQLVKERVRDAVADLQTLTGRATYRSRDPLTGEPERRRFRFATTSGGDFRLTELGGPGDLAYDASAGVERSITTSASMGIGRFHVVRRGVAPGPPDPGASDWILDRRLGAAVRALLAARDLRVRETTYDGRAAWHVILRVRPNEIYADVDRIEVTLDRATGFPVAIRTSLDGRFHDELRLRRLRVNAPLPDSAFTVPFPRGAEVTGGDEGFRRVRLEEAAAMVPYAPLVPADVPGGYRLAHVAVARRAAPTGAEAANPPSRQVVSLTYRRGFDSFTVSTRLSGPDRSRWDDPVAAGEGIREPADRLRVSRGALDGTPARLVLGPRSLPHLWAVTDELVVTVAGDLSREELLAVARSLGRAGSDRP